EPAAPLAEAIPLTIVFEDAHLMVIDKAAGMAMHPAPGSMRGTLVNAVLAHCGDALSGIGGVARPGIVHRSIRTRRDWSSWPRATSPTTALPRCSQSTIWSGSITRSREAPPRSAPLGSRRYWCAQARIGGNT